MKLVELNSLVFAVRGRERARCVLYFRSTTPELAVHPNQIKTQSTQPACPTLLLL